MHIHSCCAHVCPLLVYSSLQDAFMFPTPLRVVHAHLSASDAYKLYDASMFATADPHPTHHSHTFVLK